MPEPGTAMVTRTEAEKGLAEQLRTDANREQIRAALPESVSLERFEQAFLTAVAADEKGDLLKVERRSLFRALTKCAMDGLLPDGREAAIVAYGGKAGYLPMIGGVRKIAADYGWTIITRVVREGDEFSFSESPAEIVHRPQLHGGQGADTRAILAAYAIATHRDGRRIQRVLDRAEIEKRRKKARTQSIWNEWTAQMYEKTVGHDIFDEIPLGATDVDRERIQRVLAAMMDDPSQAAAALYAGHAGELAAPPAEAETVEATATETTDEPAAETVEATESQAEETFPAEPGAASEETAVEEATVEEATVEETEPELPIEEAEVVEETDEMALTEREQELLPDALKVKIPMGSYQGRTLQKVLEHGEAGLNWIAWALKQPMEKDEAFKQALQIVAKAQAPEVYKAWKDSA